MGGDKGVLAVSRLTRMLKECAEEEIIESKKCTAPEARNGSPLLLDARFTLKTADNAVHGQ